MNRSRGWLGIRELWILNSRFEVVIVDGDFAEDDLKVLRNLGANVLKFQTHDPEQILKITRTAHAIVCVYAPMTARIINNLQRARVIVVCGIGYDNVDIRTASEKGITVCNVPDYITFEVAEHTLALILAMTRRVTWGDKLAKNGSWRRYGPSTWRKLMPITHLDGKIVGIVGFGRIGKQVAERLRAFQLEKILAYDPFVAKHACSRMGVELVDLPELMKKSDIISINALLTDQTYHLISKDEIRMMKKTSFIVNTSRGKIIDQDALVEALRENLIAGAALDVLDKEPPEGNDPILKCENVILTPHIAFASEKAVLNMKKLALEEVTRVLCGQAPRHRINPSRKPRITKLREPSQS
jgi:D-3-phosphoglycerate dehydrogenase